MITPSILERRSQVLVNKVQLSLHLFTRNYKIKVAVNTLNLLKCQLFHKHTKFAKANKTIFPSCPYVGNSQIMPLALSFKILGISF